MTVFSAVPQEKEDPIYGLQIVYKKDPNPHKINLSIGVFPGPENNGKSFRFGSVGKAEELLVAQKLSKDYLPIDGLVSFREEMQKLLLGSATHPTLKSYIAQTVGGTAALHVGGKLLAQFITKKIYISDPTWVNHRRLFEACGLEVLSYPYATTTDGKIDLKKHLAAISSMEEGSAIILQASCHNPTGVDPTIEEWQEISNVIKQKKLIPFFDIAYQGLGKGLDEDAASIRLFLQNGHEMLIASSCSKNFGLYGERVGALSVICTNPDAISSQVRRIIRSIHSSPPSFGAYIVSTILTNPELTSLWKKELSSLREKLSKARHALYDKLLIKNPSKPFDQILNTTGLFCMTNLPEEKVMSMRKEYGLYLCDDGRINIAAICQEQLDTITKALL